MVLNCEELLLFVGIVVGMLCLFVYVVLVMVLMVFDYCNGWIWCVCYVIVVVVELFYCLVGVFSVGMCVLVIVFFECKVFIEQNQWLCEDLLFVNVKFNCMVFVVEQNQCLKELFDMQCSFEFNV